MSQIEMLRIPGRPEQNGRSNTLQNLRIIDIEPTELPKNHDTSHSHVVTDTVQIID